MKKIYLTLCVAALALVSCVKTNDVYTGTPESRQIAFAPMTSPATKVAADTYDGPIDGTVFPHDLNMYVAAYQVSPVGANYFEGTRFVYNNAGGAAASSGYWGGATARYWPLSAAQINFLAYANLTGTGTFDATTPASEVVLVQTDNSSAQTDLMYAIGHGEVIQNGNALDFPEKVDMVFKHAQAWLTFRVKAASSVEEAITINSITLNDGIYAGTFIVSHTNYNAFASQSVAGAWSDLDAAADVAVPNWSPAALTTSYVQVGDGLMIVPDGTATADFGSFTINYTYADKTYDYTFTPVDRNVEQAKHYIYDITFTLHEIYVDAAIEDWTDVVTNYVDVPSQAFAYSEAAVAGTFNVSNVAGTYSAVITGCAASTAYTVSFENSETWISGPTTVTSDASGNLNIAFTVEANETGAARNENIVLTNSALKTKVTVIQAL